MDRFRGVPTDRRSSVRLLLRGTGVAAGPGARKIAGYTTIVLGPAKAEDWIGCDFRKGDLDALTWTTPRQVSTVMAKLRGAPGVVAIRGDESEPPTGSEPPKGGGGGTPRADR